MIIKHHIYKCTDRLIFGTPYTEVFVKMLMLHVYYMDDGDSVSATVVAWFDFTPEKIDTAGASSMLL